MKEYKYKAFISYRHLKLDKAVAIKLHKMLESFRPPRGISKEKKWRIFRDEAELPTSNDLSGDIREALRSSEFLIVLCSKATGESRWCLEEMTYFKELHGMRNDHIITVLLEGTPQESFPKLLCVTRQEYTDEEGNSVFRDVEVEPLASNVASNSHRQAMRKLNGEFLRIAAPLAGCSYDQLYNRERRRKTRRFTGIALALMLLAVAFGIYNRQMRKSVEEQLLLQKIESSRFFTADSQRLFNEGETWKAIQAAYRALPEEGEDRPALAKTEYLLSQELGAYERKSFMPVMALRHDFPVEQIVYLCDGERLVTKDKNTVYLWDTQSGECIARYPEDISSDDEFYSVRVYARERHLIDQASVNRTPNMLIRYEYGFGEILGGYEKERGQRERYVEEANCFYVGDYSKTYRVDALTGEAVLLEEAESSEISFFSLHGQMYRTIESSDGGYRVELLGEDGRTIKVWNIDPTSQGEGDSFIDAISGIFSKIILLTDQAVLVRRDHEVLSYSVTGGDISQEKPVKLFDALDTGDSLMYPIEALDVGDGKVVVLSQGQAITGNEPLDVRLYSTDTGELLWHYKGEWWLYGVSDMEILSAEKAQNDSDILMVLAGNKCVLLDVVTGENIHTYTFEKAILNYYYTEDGKVFLLLADGKEVAIFPRKMSGTSNNRFFACQMHAFLTGITHCDYSDHQYAASIDGDNAVYLFQDQENPDYDEFCYYEESSISQVMVNKSGSHAMINCYKSIYLYDFGKREQKLLYEGSDYLGGKWKFAGDTTVIGEGENGNLCVYDVDSGKMLLQIDKEALGYRFQVSSVNGLVAYDELNEVICIVGKGLEEGKKLQHEREYLLRMYQVSPDFSKVAAAYGYLDLYDARIWDVESGEWTALQAECSKEKEVEWISWEENNARLALGYTDNTVEVFDADTGAAATSFSFSEYKPVSCYIGKEYIFVLCEDGTLWQMDGNGNPVRSVLLEGGEFSQLKVDMMCEELSERNLLMVSVSDSVGSVPDRWFIDLEEFEIRFFVKDCDYLQSRQELVVIDSSRNRIGLYPLYTTERLKEKAEAILEKME